MSRIASMSCGGFLKIPGPTAFLIWAQAKPEHGMI